MRSAAVTFAVVVAVMLLVFLAVPLGVKRTHLTCRGVVTEKYADATVRHPNARLGITIEELSPLLFWAEERRSFDYSHAYITDDGEVRRVMDNSIPFDSFNATFLAANFHEKEFKRNVAFFYDNISTLVQFVEIYQGNKTIFDGFCEVSEQVV